MKNIIASNVSEQSQLFCASAIIPTHFWSHQVRDHWCHLKCSVRIQEQRTRAPGKNVFDGASHLVSYRPDYFCFDVRQIRMQRLAERGLLLN